MRLIIKRKIFVVVLVELMLFTACVHADRAAENFNRNWRFTPGEQDPQVQQIAFDDSQWKTIRLPHDWAIACPFNASENGYAGNYPGKG